MRMNNLFASALLALGLATMLPGCAAGTRIPPTARQETIGHGTMAYRVPDSGQIYVLDRSRDKLCYTGFVRAGQSVRVDTASNRILVDGIPVVEQIPLDSGDQFEFYLDRRTPVVERREVIERHTVDQPYERRTVIEREIHE